MKKSLLLALLLLLFIAGAYAVDGIVTWVWYENDPMVSFYRYQVDGEDEDKWTVVDWSVNEVTIELDVSVVHTLYLQQSYDGVVWSESSSTDSEVYESGGTNQEEVYIDETSGDDMWYTEDEVPVAEEGDSVEEAVVEEEVVQEVVAVEVPSYDSVRYLDFGVGYMNAISNSAGPKTLGGFASYTHTFLKVGIFDIGVKTNLSLYTSKNLFFEVLAQKCGDLG